MAAAAKAPVGVPASPRKRGGNQPISVRQVQAGRMRDFRRAIRDKLTRPDAFLGGRLSPEHPRFAVKVESIRRRIMVSRITAEQKRLLIRSLDRAAAKAKERE